MNGKITVRRIIVTGGSGSVLLKRNMADRPTSMIRLDFPWQPKERYSLRVLSASQESAEMAVIAPSYSPAPLTLTLEIPHGTRSPQSFLPAGARFHATLLVRSGSLPGGDFTGSLTIPPGVEIDELPRGFVKCKIVDKNDQFRSINLQFRGRLTAPNEVWFRQIGLRLPQTSTKSIIFKSSLQVTKNKILTRVTRKVFLRTPETLARAITIEKTHLPTDEMGNADLRRIADTLFLPGGSGNFIRSLFGQGSPPINPYLPFRYQTVWLRNQSTAAIPVMATSRVLSLDGKTPVPFLQAPELISGGTGRSVAFTILPPKATTPVVLPVFMDPRSAAIGSYLREFRLRLWGTDTEILKADLPVEVRRPSLRAFLVTVTALFLSLLGILFLIAKGGSFLGNLPVRLLSGAATFAAAMFVLSTVPDLFAGNLVKAFLGPFSFFISGIFTEMAVYALGAVYLMRYPIPGALSLLVIIRALILSLTLYSVQIVSLLMIGAEIFILEGAVWLAGITRGEPGQKLFERWPQNQWRAILIGGVAFVTADVLITAASFHLHIFFYRLIYADWYIVLYLIVTSGLFTFAGTALGLRLGGPLREVAG
jgi:hypothetical protein